MGEKKDKKKSKAASDDAGEAAAPKQLNISIIAKPLADDKILKKVCSNTITPIITNPHMQFNVLVDACNNMHTHYFHGPPAGPKTGQEGCQEEADKERG